MIIYFYSSADYSSEIKEHQNRGKYKWISDLKVTQEVCVFYAFYFKGECHTSTVSSSLETETVRTCHCL